MSDHCACGSNTEEGPHLTEELSETTLKFLELLVADVKEHMHLGDAPCDKLLKALEELNNVSGVMMVVFLNAHNDHEEIIATRARNN